MTTGDQDDIVARITRELPKRWFADAPPVLSGVLAAFGQVGATCYALVQFARAQMRLGTMSGGWLDLFALDYFGSRFPRRARDDDAFRAAIGAELLRERATRAGISRALEDLTGTPPTIIEPWNAADCGAYDLGGIAYAGSDFVPSEAGGYDLGAAYDIGTTSYDALTGATGNTSPGMGCWGSLEVPYQLFVTAYRLAGGGIPGASGTDTGGQGYDIGAFAYVDESEVATRVSDDEILAAVAATQPAGVIAWTAIEDAPALAA